MTSSRAKKGNRERLARRVVVGSLLLSALVLCPSAATRPTLAQEPPIEGEVLVILASETAGTIAPSSRASRR